VVLGAASGTNYVDSITGEVTFVITGKTTVSFKITETIQLSSTLAVEESSFYGDDFVNNIMMSLNINPLRLKVTNVVPGRRRRRGLLEDTSEVAWEIAEEDFCAGDSVSAEGLWRASQRWQQYALLYRCHLRR
ncbi:hypothetical protein CYMTET_39562, partial [Cymbomonas tetramitiformis]